MDETIKLFVSIKTSQIHKIKNAFDFYTKSVDEATEELYVLSGEIEELKRKNNSTEFSNAADKVIEKIENTVKLILQEDSTRN